MLRVKEAKFEDSTVDADGALVMRFRAAGRNTAPVWHPGQFLTDLPGGFIITVRGDNLEEVKALYEAAYDQTLVWVGRQGEFGEHRSHPPAPVEEQLRPAQLTQRANERDARRRVETQGELGSGQVVCPEHNRALMGNHGLYCPTKLADGSWCKWRPGRKAAA